MARLITTAALILFMAIPAMAQEAGPGGGGAQEGTGDISPQPTRETDDGGVGVAGEEGQDRQLIQQENAARTEVPPVRGAERTPEQTPQEGQVSAQAGQETTPGQEPRVDEKAYGGDQGQVAGQETTLDEDAYAGRQQEDVTQRATTEATTELEGETGTEYGGGAMPTTSSPLPVLLLSGAALLIAGAALRLAASRR